MPKRTGFWINQETIPNPQTNGRTSLIQFKVGCKTCQTVSETLRVEPGSGRTELTRAEAEQIAREHDPCDVCLALAAEPIAVAEGASLQLS